MRLSKGWMMGGLLAVVLTCTAATDENCTAPPTQASTSGVKATQAQVKAGADGLTIEQRNVKDRLTEDNKPGAIKHLYVISAYSGQVLLYSTVRGKVTSSGKRLAPSTISDIYNRAQKGFAVEAGNATAITQEVLGDDGTYGPSVEYIYWWDSQGVYHQHYIQGGQIVHVASQPIAVKSIVLNLEQR